jgi:hypothetical protein
MNYRVNGMQSFAVKSMALTSTQALGFLGGKEVKEEGIGNLGLLDRENIFHLLFLL